MIKKSTCDWRRKSCNGERCGEEATHYVKGGTMQLCLSHAEHHINVMGESAVVRFPVETLADVTKERDDWKRAACLLETAHKADLQGDSDLNEQCLLSAYNLLEELRKEKTHEQKVCETPR